MAKRPITITIDEDIDLRIKELQKEISTTSKTPWSYSKLANILLGMGLEKFKTNKNTLHSEM